MVGFAQNFEELPETLPVFPLPGALLLPHGRLSLNIFEPRYLNMIDDALRTDRLIGMIQPSDEGDPAPIYPVGCAGRIVQLAETDDRRYLISLAGLYRFRIVQELDSSRGYRRVQADWAPFAKDLDEAEEASVDRGRLMELLQRYFEQQELSVDWDALKQADNETVLTVLAMNCPFAVPEKQALLEAGSAAERAKVLMTLLEMAVAEGLASGEGPSH